MPKKNEISIPNGDTAFPIDNVHAPNGWNRTSVIWKKECVTTGMCEKTLILETLVGPSTSDVNLVWALLAPEIKNRQIFA